MTKYKSVIIFVFCFTLVYTILTIIIAPFIGFNFGAESTMLEKVVGFFLKFPFGYINGGPKSNFILFIILNGVFWGGAIYLIRMFIQR